MNKKQIGSSRRHWRILLGIAILSAGLAGVSLPAWGADAASTSAPTKVARRPAVLFTGHFYQRGVNPELAGAFQKAGFTVNADMYPGLRIPLTWERLRQYNVVVVRGLDNSDGEGNLTENNRNSIALLKRFMEEGGGVLFTPVYLHMHTMLPPQTAFLGEYGLKPLFDEKVLESGPRVYGTAYQIPFVHTSNFPAKDSPILQGVSSLWFPEATSAGAQIHTVPLTVDKNWTVLAAGEATASTHTIPHDQWHVTPEVLAAAPGGTYAKAPVLMASRSVGKGRLVVLGIAPEYTVGERSTTALDRIVYDKGLNGAPSDGRKLVMNTVQWLSEPSAGSTVLGGAPMDTKLLEDPAKVKFLPPWDWQKRGQPPADPRAYPGVFGARSAYSSGKGSVSDWVAAAKAAKLSYVVFLEDFAALEKSKLEALKKDCAQATDETFAAIPGFTIDDEIGNHYYWVASDVAWPDDKWLAPDGKHFGIKPGKLKGSLAGPPANYGHGQCGQKVFGGNFLFTQSPAPFVDWYNTACSAAVITCRDGQPLEDITPDYLKLSKSGQGMLPVAINFVDDPARLNSSSWRTVITLPEGAKNDTTSPVAKYLSSGHYYPDDPVGIQISNGPRIDNWSFAGPRDYEGAMRGDFVWQNYRWRVYGKVSSAVGLKEVVVYDGPQVLRRFLPRGEKEFTVNLELTHDRQHTLVLAATDSNGGRVLSGDQWDRNHRLEEFMCGDRNNQITYGYTVTSDGYGLLNGGMQGHSTPYKRVDNKHISPAGAFLCDLLLGAEVFDGGPGGPEPLISMPLNMQAKDGPGGSGKKLLNSPTVSESFRLLHSGDVAIGDGHWERYFTDNITIQNVWGTLWKTAPAEDFTVVKRNYHFQLDPDSPLAVFLWSADVTLKRDLPNHGMNVAGVATRQAKMWSIHSSEGQSFTGVWDDSGMTAGRNLDVPFGPGAYLAALDSPLGGVAVYPLTDGLRCSAYLPANRRMSISLPENVSPQKKGETAHCEVLMIGIPRPTARTRNLPGNTTEVVERFRTDFGLGEKPAAYAIAATTGKIISARYPLKIDGTSDQCFSGRITGKIVSALPIAVSGLHSHWSALLYDRGLQQARPLGSFENTAWATVVINAKTDLFIGHPVVCDHPQVTIQVTQTDETQWTIEVHNPSDQPLDVKLSANPNFDPLKDHPAQTVKLPPGTSSLVTW
ncbi:MAG: hypothetical protein WCI73_01990 [Phycisphaerae bacterium]